MPKPGNLDPWGATPTFHGYQGGDLVGVTERLDYLADLGINAIYFTPIFQSASNHRYHTHDYEKVEAHQLLSPAAVADLLESDEPTLLSRCIAPHGQCPSVGGVHRSTSGETGAVISLRDDHYFPFEPVGLDHRAHQNRVCEQISPRTRQKR